MTDQPEATPPATGEAAATDAAPASTADIAPVPGAAIAAVTDGVYYLIVAQFPDTAAAAKAYDLLRELETTTTLAIDGVVVARREADGKVHLEQLTEHSTRSGLGWGVVGGIALAALFPPTLLAGAVGGGVIGAAAGKVRNLVRRSEVEKELESALDPGTSGHPRARRGPGGRPGGARARRGGPDRVQVGRQGARDGDRRGGRRRQEGRRGLTPAPHLARRSPARRQRWRRNASGSARKSRVTVTCSSVP